jgi:N-acyl-D-aspartate/D-glutamate deacylase
MYDLVIKGGRVVDGTGAPAFSGDIAVTDGRIVEVGRVSGTARETVDADGAVVSPGWIDGHTHYDGQVTWDDALAGSARHGVTTVVTGNCGVGFAPSRPANVNELIDLMEGVEDIPGTALYEGIPWGEWESFPEYMDFLGGRSWSLDVAPMVPFGSLRYYVMGAKSVEAIDPTADELAEMARLVEAAMRAGAAGFSMSRILSHMSMSGFSVPGTLSGEHELTGIAEGIARGGGGTIQVQPSGGAPPNPTIGPDPITVPDEVRMFGRITRKTGLRCTFSNFQLDHKPTEWREVLAVAEEENRSGAYVRPMVSSRAFNALMSLDGYHSFMLKPSYRRIAELPVDERAREMARPEVKAAILAEENVPDRRKGSMDNKLSMLFTLGLDRVYGMEDPIDYEPTADRSMASQAAAAGRDPLEFLYDYLIGQNGTAVAIWFGLNYADQNLDSTRAMLQDRNSVVGLSDAGAHVKFLSDMSVPTFLLSHWVSNRVRGDGLPIELLVAKGTSAVAETFGLHDRGTLQPGRRADVNVIDLERLRLGRPSLHADLPAGGRRYLQPVEGYVATFVAGVRTGDHDQDTGQRPGRLVRAR